MKRDEYTFFEYEVITDGEGGLPHTAFLQLKRLIAPRTADIVDDPPTDGGADASLCFSLCVKDGREAIRVNNYVGTVALPCGVTVEILPKIARRSQVAAARRLVIAMLKACGSVPYRAFSRARLREADVSLFEIYIRLFLDEVHTLARKGLRAGYNEIEENTAYICGKMLFEEQIRRNLVHREQFYVRRDEFTFDRAENKLIKTTLNVIRPLSRDEQNLRDIRRFLRLFDEIAPSENIEQDFAACACDRTAEDYAPALKLCRVFLGNRGLSPYVGRTETVALLFPMEKLFERYIAHEMKAYVRDSAWKLYEQEAARSLYDGRQFLLRPDILLRGPDGEGIIIDTKWKRLSLEGPNFGISQADMYQMYAYHTRYENIRKVVLLYPLQDPLSIDDYVIRDMGITVSVRFFDLYGYLDGKSFEQCIC